MTTMTPALKRRTDYRRALAALGTAFAAMGQGIEACRVANERAREFENLQALSDGQLATRGLRREDIARHVFRDIL